MTPDHPRATRWAALIAAPLVAAGALALLLRSTDPAPFGEYQVEVKSADVTTHGAAPPAAPAPSVFVQSGRQFEMIVHPVAPIQGDVGVRAFLVRDGRASLWNATVQLSREGVVRIAGDVENLFGGRPGLVTILIAVGRPSALPETPEKALRAEGADGGNAQWRLLRTEILLGKR